MVHIFFKKFLLCNIRFFCVTLPAEIINLKYNYYVSYQSF